MQINKYSHLNVEKMSNAFDWKNNMLTRALPQRAFVNAFTSGFLTSIQMRMVTGFDQVKHIKTYFRF